MQRGDESVRILAGCGRTQSVLPDTLLRARARARALTPIRPGCLGDHDTASKASIERNANAARLLLRKVIDTGMMGFFEYDMAQAYLDWNDLPKVARAPLSAGG